jgi:hypothetical protein
MVQVVDGLSRVKSHVRGTLQGFHQGCVWGGGGGWRVGRGSSRAKSQPMVSADYHTYIHNIKTQVLWEQPNKEQKFDI